MSNTTSGEKQMAQSGVGMFGLLGLIFITLKLLGQIDWSWLWVLSPFWMPIALVILLGTLAAILHVARDG